MHILPEYSSRLHITLLNSHFLPIKEHIFRWTLSARLTAFLVLRKFFENFISFFNGFKGNIKLNIFGCVRIFHKVKLVGKFLDFFLFFLYFGLILFNIGHVLAHLKWYFFYFSLNIENILANWYFFRVVLNGSNLLHIAKLIHKSLYGHWVCCFWELIYFHCVITWKKNFLSYLLYYFVALPHPVKVKS